MSGGSNFGKTMLKKCEMIGDTMSDKVSDNSVDVSSVFSETDREGLDIAMTLMNDDELQTLQVRKGRRSAGGKNALSQHDLATFFFFAGALASHLNPASLPHPLPSLPFSMTPRRSSQMRRLGCSAVTTKLSGRLP